MKIKQIRAYLIPFLVFVLLAGCAGKQVHSQKFDLPFKNSMANAKSGTFIVEPANFKIRLWSPVNRTAGYVIQNVEVTGFYGRQLALSVKGAGQLANVAFVNIPITEDQSALLAELFNSKGTQVRVKLRFETFTYIVK